MRKARTKSEWEECIRRYCERQKEITRQQDYCDEVGLSKSMFRFWLYRLTTVGSSGERVWNPSAGQRIERTQALVVHTHPAEKPPRLVLDARDVEVLRSLAHDRVNSIDVVAARYFVSEEAAWRRIRQLRRSAYVTVLQREGGVVSLTQKGARSIGARAPRRMHPRHLRHHLETIRAIERFKMSVEAKGGELVPFTSRRGEAQPYRLEIHVQSESRGNAGRGTRRGERYEAAPDAVVQVRWPSGAVQTVAIEYYTKSYSDEQMGSKAQLFQQYATVYQIADSNRTAERVAEISGHPCEVAGQT